MKVLVITAQKGGVGKTTHCGHLAVELTLRGKRVVIVDTDPHAGLTEWWDDRKAEDIQLLNLEFKHLAAGLKRLEAEGVDYVIIDTPGVASKAVKVLIEYADLVIVPTKASRHDLRGIRKTLELMESEGEPIEKPMIFVLNEVRPRTKLETQAIMAIGQYGKMAPVVHSLNEFVSSMNDGRACVETAPKSKAADQTRALADYVLRQVGDYPRPQPRKQPRTYVEGAE